MERCTSFLVDELGVVDRGQPGLTPCRQGRRWERMGLGAVAVAAGTPPKQSLERRMELEESTFLTSDYTTKPQPSIQYGNGTKTEI